MGTASPENSCSERVEMRVDGGGGDPGCDCPTSTTTTSASLTLNYYRLSIMSVRTLSGYASVVCRLIATALHTLLHLRTRQILIKGLFSIIDLVSRGALYMPTKKIDPLLKSLKATTLRRAIEATPEPEKSVHCDVLHDPGATLRRMDVIFIHGLKGSLERTWKQGLWDLKGRDSSGRVLLRKSSSASSINYMRVNDIHRQSSESNLSLMCEESGRDADVKEVVSQDGPSANRGFSRCWPRDWLPQDCPGVRVIALNYTTDPYLWRPVWVNKRCRTSMSERAWEMMQHLSELGVGKHPIVWVGHSKGGLFVKQMLVHACGSSEPSMAALAHQSRGILFYSVPHRGSPLANLNLPLLRQSIELTEVQKDSAEVIALHKKFRELLDNQKINVEVRSFIETTLTLMSLVYVRIVSVESADAEVGELYGVPIDHRNICKPRSRNCFLYKELLSLIEAVMPKQST